MEDDITINQLCRDATIRRMLSVHLDFDMNTVPQSDSFFRIDPSIEPELIAGDSGGGMFFLCNPGRAVWFVSTDATAGIVGRSLRQWLSIQTALPYWRDLLKFSGGGQLDEMRRAGRLLQVDYAESEPDLANHLAVLNQLLGLREPADPITTLRENVMASFAQQRMFVHRDGGELGNLFGQFSVDDNRLWRSRIK